MRYAITSLVSILCYIVGMAFDIEWMELFGFIAVAILAWVGVIGYVFEPEKIWKDEGL